MSLAPLCLGALVCGPARAAPPGWPARTVEPIDRWGRGGLEASRPPPAPRRFAVCPQDGPPFVVEPVWARARRIAVHPNGRWQRIELDPGTYAIGWEKAVPMRATVAAGLVTILSEPCLILAGAGVADPQQALPLGARSALPAGTVVVGASGGRRLGGESSFGRFSLAGWTTELVLHIALTDRLQWPTLPALAYRFGDAGNVEWIPWLGMYNWGFEIPDDRVPVPFLDPGTTDITLPDFRLAAFIGAGLGVRWWVTESSSVVFTTESVSVARLSISEEARIPPTTWRQSVAAGYSITLPRSVVTLSFAVGVSGNFLYQGRLPKVHHEGRRFDFAISFGSLQSMSLRRLPLAMIHLNDFLHIDIHAQLDYFTRTSTFQETYLLGLAGEL